MLSPHGPESLLDHMTTITSQFSVSLPAALITLFLGFANRLMFLTKKTPRIPFSVKKTGAAVYYRSWKKRMWLACCVLLISSASLTYVFLETLDGIKINGWKGKKEFICKQQVLARINKTWLGKGNNCLHFYQSAAVCVFGRSGMTTIVIFDSSRREQEGSRKGATQVVAEEHMQGSDL